MRIRKHAKISPLIYATSYLQPGTVIQTHVCLLNQSPWDVINFSPPSAPPPPPPSPPPLKVSKNSYSEIINGSSRDSISVVESKEFDDSWRKFEYSDGSNAFDKAEETEEEELNNIILCCKSDGKSWRCKREALPGHSMCKHHLTMMTNYSNLAHAPPKKQAVAAEVAKLRPRPKKASASSSSNPYEFYYYSGFGPRWGKKRGEVKSYNDYDMPKNLEHEHENEPSMVSPFVEDNFKYSEDEEEDDEYQKKRPRKPIKARSLKSLM